MLLARVGTAEPECTRRKGHRWVPVVTTLSRFCPSCLATLPLTGDGYRRAKRIRLLGDSDGWRCRYCRIPLVPDASPGLMPNAHGLHVSVATVDHVVPLCAGGRNVLANLALSCSWCNGRKGERDWEWLRLQPDFMARLMGVARMFSVDPEPYLDDLLDYVAAHELWFGSVEFVGSHGGTSVARWMARHEAWARFEG